MFTVFDLLLIVIAVILMLTGFARRWVFWKNSCNESPVYDWKGLAAYLFSHKKIMKRRTAGIAHFFIFWGFIIFMVVMVLAQFDFILSSSLAKVLSMLLDMFGLVLFIGILFFLGRYLSKRSDKDKITPSRVFIPGLIILFIVITGFLAEGARLSILARQFSWISPVGWMTSQIMPESPLLMQLMIRTHFFLVLIFVSLMPFTFMRHVPASALNILCRPKGQMGDLGAVPGGKKGVGIVTDFSWKQLLDAEACVSCGRCVENCPAAIAGKSLSPEKILQKILGMLESNNKRNQFCLDKIISPDEIWACTTCMACVEQCPVYTDPVDKIIDLRRYETMCKGTLPSEVRPMIRNLELLGDTYGKGTAYKTDWIHDHKVDVLSKNHSQTDVLLWVGCSGAFHPRYQEVLRSMIRILNHAKIEFAILGKKELCCGDQARRLGQEKVFSTLAKKNIDSMTQYDFKKIVTLCPHCLHSLKHEYPKFGGKFNVVHASELVISLINENKINIKYPQETLLTIHDPCYLGRVNKIYQPLRDIGKSVAGVAIQELERNCENGFCCGGGGGQMWLHDSIGRHINHIRAEEIIDSGADMVATACPYCLTMLEDGISAAESDKPPRVVDIIEIVASSIG